MAVPTQRQVECCPDQRVCEGCGRAVCPEHDEDVARCEFNGPMHAPCHEDSCTSILCLRENTPSDD